MRPKLRRLIESLSERDSHFGRYGALPCNDLIYRRKGTAQHFGQRSLTPAALIQLSLNERTWRAGFARSFRVAEKRKGVHLPPRISHTLDKCQYLFYRKTRKVNLCLTYLLI